MTDEAGNIVNSYEYDAWGNVNEETQVEGISNPIKYAGEFQDPETGLYYLRARYYDPKIGRFTQEDPIRDEKNWYIYCGNNPVNFVDPSGLYDRESAVKYAMWMSVNSYGNPFYPEYFSNDCTNFVSNCLPNGDIEQTDKWHYHPYLYINGKTNKYTRDMTKSWSLAKEQFDWITNPDNGYLQENGIICFHETKWISWWAENGGIKPGDLIYWYFQENGEITHASIIVEVKDGKIKYAQHTSDKNDGDLENAMIENKDCYAYVVKIKDNVK
jgi:RHS repeat-associated protein